MDLIATVLRRQNPYSDTAEFGRVFAADHIAPLKPWQDYHYVLDLYPRFYPLTTLLVLAPLETLRWRTVVLGYLAGSTALFLAVLLLLARKLKMPWNDPRKLYFLAFSLAMAPLHASIHQSNLNTIAIACLCPSVGLMARRPLLSGIALAAALCVKPQVALLFLAYMLLKKRWKVAFFASTVYAMAWACSLAWMGMHHVPWLAGLRNEYARASLLITVNPAFPTDPGIFQMVNLRVLVAQFAPSAWWTGTITWALCAFLACASAFLVCTRRASHLESARIAVVAALTLLPVYQRFYTAQILLFGLYWAVENWDLKAAWAVRLLLLPLLFPITQIIARIDAVTNFVAAHHLDTNRVWNGLVLPHTIWIELMVLCVLLAYLFRQKGTTHAQIPLPAARRPI